MLNHKCNFILVILRYIGEEKTQRIDFLLLEDKIF